jgi:hypothetical protein
MEHDSPSQLPRPLKDVFEDKSTETSEISTYSTNLIFDSQGNEVIGKKGGKFQLNPKRISYDMSV